MERNRKQRRVVVTGMGCVSPIGNTVQDAWQSAANGKSGIDVITHFDTSELEVHFGGAVKDFGPEKILNPRDLRRIDRVGQFGLVAADEAMTDSGLEVTADNHYEIGCVVGTGIGGIETLIDIVDNMRIKGIRSIKPTAMTAVLPNSICSQISMRYGIRGPVFAISTACATGNSCIGEATEIIRRGAAKAVLAGSSEAGMGDFSLSGFTNMTATSRRNDSPQQASRPFDIDRDGFVVSEGAGVLVLEDLEHALERGAKIYAEILGYGHTADAFHVTAPLETGESAAQAIKLALRDADIRPQDIDYINAHGTSTQLNDKSETLAIKRALGDCAYQVAISSTKSVTGHMMAGAAAVEAVLTLMAMTENFAPPTINLDTPDPDCDLNYTPQVGQSRRIDIAMSNSFGFGGHNAVIIFGKYQQ